MLLTISTTYRPATDLGYLLHKHPDRLQTFELAFGRAYVFFPEATAERSTAALLLDVDPIGLVRRSQEPGFALAQYVNDRPYVASSFLSVAIRAVYGSALGGKSKDRPELSGQAIPLEARLPMLPSRGGADLIQRLFVPLGYDVTTETHLLDETFPEWGVSPYNTVTLSASCRLRDLLSHLYVLIPVLDDDKHYWVGDDEVDKLLRAGEGWLPGHPERALIARRYLKHQRSLADEALLRLTDGAAPDREVSRTAMDEAALEATISLNEARLAAARNALKNSGARRVLDLGCGNGQLLKLLLEDRSFETITGMDVSHRAVEIASARLKLDHLPPLQRQRVQIFQGSLLYRDSRLANYDAAAVIEVIEHLDPGRLTAFERVLFEFARPLTIVLTTPNAEYNNLFAGLPSGSFRHRDHQFEWSRIQFESWSKAVAERSGYAVAFHPVGAADPQVGSPTQMAIFSRPGGNPCGK